MYHVLFWCIIISISTQARTFAPSAPCFEMSQCPDDYYCETSISFCRQCLQCNEFKREEPADAGACVMEVAKCGPCLTGYVDKVECVPPSAWWEHLIVPYNWLISSFVLIALIVCVAIMCVLIKLRVYTLRATVSTKQSTSAVSLPAELAPPPPYNSVTCSVPLHNIDVLNREASLPQIRPVLHKILQEQESMEYHTAICSRPPDDGYGPPPPRYESETRDIANQSEERHTKEFGNETSNTVNANVEATDPDCPPSARKSLRDRQDSSSSDSSGEPSGRTPYGNTSTFYSNQHYAPLIINVIKNDSVVQQNNDVSI